LKNYGGQAIPLVGVVKEAKAGTAGQVKVAPRTIVRPYVDVQSLTGGAPMIPENRVLSSLLPSHLNQLSL